MTIPENKVSIKPNAFGFPMPVTLVGTMVAGRANFLAVSWIGRVNVKPPLIAIAVGQSHHSTQGLQDSGCFSVNVPSADMVDATDYCGLTSGKTVDKSELFDVFFGQNPAAPMIRQCPVTMECEIQQTVALPVNTLYIAEIKAAYSESQFIDSGGRIDMSKTQPFCLTMLDNNYWNLGNHLADAWACGKEFTPPAE